MKDPWDFRCCAPNHERCYGCGSRGQATAVERSMQARDMHGIPKDPEGHDA